MLELNRFLNQLGVILCCTILIWTVNTYASNTQAVNNASIIATFTALCQQNQTASALQLFIGSIDEQPLLWKPTQFNDALAIAANSDNIEDFSFIVNVMQEHGIIQKIELNNIRLFLRNICHQDPENAIYFINYFQGVLTQYPTIIRASSINQDLRIFEIASYIQLKEIQQAKILIQELRNRQSIDVSTMDYLVSIIESNLKQNEPKDVISIINELEKQIPKHIPLKLKSIKRTIPLFKSNN